MRIQSNDVIAGQPALKIRKLLKLIDTYPLGAGITTIAEILDSDLSTSKQVIQELHAGGYIELLIDKDGEKWQTTIKGNALAHATARKPITRKTAERLLTEFLNRVQEVNQSDDYAYHVKQVILFGSFLSNSETLGDIDLAIFLEPRYTDPDKQKQLTEKRTRYALTQGKGRIDAIFWPHVEVFQILKGRSPSISIHDGKAEQILFESEPSKILYEAPSNTATSNNVNTP